MHSLNLVKWSGPAAMLAGVLFGVWGQFNIAESALATVVPLLFLLALVGLRTRCLRRASWLGEAGFVLGFVALIWGGVVRHFVDKTALYRYFVAGGWPPWLSSWFAWLLIAVIVIGVAATATNALRYYGVLSLTVGSFGWLFFSTDAAGVIETPWGHTAFGALFCLSWMALGYALWKDIGYLNAPPFVSDARKRTRAVRSFVRSTVSRFAGN